nr:transposase family protein [Micromonospora carbonacea]
MDAWYSGKHRDFGANIQAVLRPDGLPIWTSDAMPGHLHDLTCAQRLDVTGALYWTASELRLPTLADSGYEGAGQGIHTPCKQPADGRRLAVDNARPGRRLQVA